MKTKRTVLLLVLVLFSLNSILHSAGTKDSKSSDQDIIELRISWWGSTSRHEATLKALDLFMEKNPKIKVVAEYQGYDGYNDKLVTQIHAGTEPDIFKVDNNTTFVDLASNGLLANLTPYIGNGIDLSDYPKDLLEWGSYKGIPYGIPTGMNGPVLLYNTVIFDKAGVPYPTDQWTWDDLIAAASKIHSVDSSLYGMEEPGAYITEALMRQDGYWFTDTSGNLQDFSKKLGSIYAQYNEWRTSGILPPLDLTIGQDSQSNNLFLAGRCAMRINHVATYPQTQSGMKNGDNVGIAMLPEVSDKGGVFMLGSMPFSLSIHTKHPTEAIKLLDFLINDIDAGKILTTQRGVPGPEHIREAIIPILDKNSQKVVDAIAKLVDATTRIDYEWLLPGASMIEVVLQEEQHNTGFKQKSPEQAGRDVYKRIAEAGK